MIRCLIKCSLSRPIKLDLSNCLIAESAACGIAIKEKDNVDFKETNSSFSGNTGENRCVN